MKLLSCNEFSRFRCLHSSPEEIEIVVDPRPRIETFETFGGHPFTFYITGMRVIVNLNVDHAFESAA